jgi:hypothetical protein
MQPYSAGTTDPIGYVMSYIPVALALVAMVMAFVPATLLLILHLFGRDRTKPASDGEAELEAQPSPA